MAELVYSSFVPIQTAVISRQDSKRKAEYETLGYEVEEMSGDLYHLIKPPKLEMVFREGDKDYVFDMYDELKIRFKSCDMNNIKIAINLARVFAYRITIGKIKVSISSDGSYTLNEL